MKNKVFKITISLAFLGLLSVPIYNYFDDEYGVFGRRYNCLYSNDIFQNEQHFKLNRIVDKRLPACDSIIFGSSQAEAISTIKLGRNWYNISAMTISPFEFIDSMEFLKSHNVEIKNVLFLIQPDVVFMGRKKSFSEKDKYFMLTGFPFKHIEKPRFYMNYLFMSPSQQNKDIYVMDYFFKIKELYDGSIVNKDDLGKIEHKNKNDMQKPSDLEYQPKMSEEVLFEMKKIRDYCISNNIDLKVLISPDYIKASESYDKQEFAKFKKELAKIMPFYDFSGENDITTNDEYYMNFDHFSEDVGNLIIDRIYHQDKNTPPKIKNFGVYIKKSL